MEVLNQPKLQGQATKNIVQVVQHLAPGGIETMAIDMVNTILPNTHMSLLSLEGTKHTLSANWERLASLRIDWDSLNKRAGIDFAIIESLYEYFVENKVDVVHTHHIGPLLYAGIAAKKAGCKVVHTEHDAWHLQSKKRAFLQRSLLYYVKPLVVADANAVAETFAKKMGRPVDTIITNGVNVEKFKPDDQMNARQKFNLPHHVKLIGSAGRLEVVKGQRYLIEALSKLGEDTHLTIAGSGSSLNALSTLINELGLEKRVHMIGHVEDMASFYNALDIFCLPSLQEGFPLTPLEAQACNIRVVVSDVGGSKDTLCPMTGIAVPAGNVDALAKSLLSMLQYNETFSPREFIKEHYNFANKISIYNSLYHKVQK